MNSLVAKNIDLLRCPDDGERLNAPSESYLECNGCRRQFRMIPPSFVELLPLLPEPIPESLQNAFEGRFFSKYQSLFFEPFLEDPRSMAWGAPEVLNRTQLRRKTRQIEEVVARVGPGHKTICDVTAGAGYYTLRMAREFGLVINADLDVKNLNYVMRKTKEAGLENILFVRADIFQPPFSTGCFDLVLCTDTLAYGDLMVRAFLKHLVDLTSVSGRAILDFYNRMHRNPFHAPYMTGYNRKECEQFLKEIEGIAYDYFGFYQELGGRLRWLIPSTRHVFTIRKLGA